MRGSPVLAAFLGRDLYLRALLPKQLGAPKSNLYETLDTALVSDVRVRYGHSRTDTVAVA